MADQIEGLPKDAVVGPDLQSQGDIEGLPKDAVVGPALPTKAQATTQEYPKEKPPGLLDKADTAITSTLNENPNSYKVPKLAGRTLYQGAKTVLGMIPGAYHAFADPATEAEKAQNAEFEKEHNEEPGTETSGVKRIGLGVQRLSGADAAVDAAKTYADPTTRPTWEQAKSVLPEAIGEGAGVVAAGELGGKIIEQAPAMTRAVGRGITKVGENAKPIGAGVGAAAGLPRGPMGAWFEGKIGAKIGDLASGPIQAVGQKMSTVGLGPEAKLVTHWESEARKADSAVAKAKEGLDKFAPSVQGGPPLDPEENPAYKKAVDAHNKAQTATNEAHFHLDNARQAAKTTATPAAPTPPSQPITPEVVAAARPAPEPAAPAAAPKPVTPENVKTPGQVQPETFPQTPTERPEVPRMNQRLETPGGAVRIGRTPQLEGVPERPLLAAGTPEAVPEVPPKMGRVGAEKATKPIRLPGEVPREPVDLTSRKQEYAGEKQPPTFEAPKTKEGAATETKTETDLLGSEKELKNAEVNPEHESKAEQVLSQHSDQDLIRFAKKSGIDADKYDFAVRDENRHRVERDQLVKDLLAKLPDADKSNIARLSDEFNKKDSTLWSEAERSNLSKAQRSRAIMQEHEGGPKPVGGGAPDTSEDLRQPTPELRDLAKDFAGKDLDHTKVEKDTRGPEIADAYDKLKHAPNDPKVKAAYDALNRETKAQWKALQDKGYTMSTSPTNPYDSAEDMLHDIKNNKHITVWEGGTPPDDHPMSQVDPESGLTNNTLFRAVHDILGHGKEGNDFSEAGEENAFRQHSQMYSQEAQPALATETKGQASWVFNHKGVRDGSSMPGDQFPEQKAALMPKEFQSKTYKPDNSSGEWTEYPNTNRVLDHIKDDKPFAVLTAENPKNTRISDAENSKLNDQLMKDLKDKGYEPVPVEGHNKDVEGQTEHSFFVPDIKLEDAVTLGKKYDQAAILTHEGLHDLTTNKVNPSDNGKVLTGDEARKEPYYSIVNGEPFSVPLDFSKSETSKLVNEKGSPIDVFGNPKVSGGVDKPTTGRVNKFGELVGDAEVTPNKSAMAVFVKPPEGFRVVGNNANLNGTAAKFEYGKYKDYKTPKEAKTAAEKFASEPNNFLSDTKNKRADAVEKKEVTSGRQNDPPENFTHKLKEKGRDALKKITDDSTIIVTPEGAVHHYTEYDPSAEQYTHSSLFNQILSTDEGELGKYQQPDEDLSPYDPTGDSYKFQEAGGIRAFTTGPEEAGIEIHSNSPAGTIAKALQVADALGREDTTLEVLDSKDFKTVFSKSGTYDQVRNAIMRWADDNDKEVYPGEKTNPTVSGGSPAADEAKLPNVAEKHLTPEERAGVTKTDKGREAFVNRLTSMPEVREFTDAAVKGEGGRKWYQRGAKAMDHLAEEAPEYFDKPGDREKFAGVLAASSPQQSVVMNMREALRAWTKYVDAGRPEGPKLEKLLRSEFTLPDAKVPNAMKAIEGKPLWPDLTKNKNFKVPSFAANLNGMLDKVTNDGWMALFSGLKATDIQTAGGYHPISVMTRAAADELGWEPAEAQAAVWAFIKTLTEKGEEDPHAIRNYSEDFADILRHDPETRHLLQEMGVTHEQLDAKLDRIEAKPEISGRTSSTAEDSSSRARQRVETARGKEAIPQPKSGDLFAKLGDTTKDEGTEFNPETFNESPVKLKPLSERGGKSILSIKVDGKSAGQISMTRMSDLGKNAAEMSTAQLKPEFQGKGHGVEAYRQALDYAKDKGYDTVYSDDQVSDKAQNVWKSLVRSGDAVWDGKLKRFKSK